MNTDTYPPIVFSEIFCTVPRDLPLFSILKRWLVALYGRLSQLQELLIRAKSLMNLSLWQCKRCSWKVILNAKQEEKTSPFVIPGLCPIFLRNVILCLAATPSFTVVPVDKIRWKSFVKSGRQFSGLFLLQVLGQIIPLFYVDNPHVDNKQFK